MTGGGRRGRLGTIGNPAAPAADLNIHFQRTSLRWAADLWRQPAPVPIDPRAVRPVSQALAPNVVGPMARRLGVPAACRGDRGATCWIPRSVGVASALVSCSARLTRRCSGPAFGGPLIWGVR